MIFMGLIRQNAFVLKKFRPKVEKRHTLYNICLFILMVNKTLFDDFPDESIVTVSYPDHVYSFTEQGKVNSCFII